MEARIVPIALIANRFERAEFGGCPKSSFWCVLNSLGPIQSLNPAGFLDATRTKYDVFDAKLLIKYVIPESIGEYVD